MPWGTILIGVFFVAGLMLALPFFVTGTSSVDMFIKSYVPMFVTFVFGIVLVFGWLNNK